MTYVIYDSKPSERTRTVTIADDRCRHDIVIDRNDRFLGILKNEPKRKTFPIWLLVGKLAACLNLL